MSSSGFLVTKSSEKTDDVITQKKIEDAIVSARDLFDQGKYIQALEFTEKTISHHEKHERCFSHHELQGDIFFQLAGKTDDSNIKCVYLFASVDAFSVSTLLCPYALSSYRGSARSLIQLGQELRINKFYEKGVSKAKRGLLVKQPIGLYTPDNIHTFKTELQTLIVLATEKSKTALTVYATRTKPDQTILIKKDPHFDRFKNFWVNMDDKAKKDFLVLDSIKLIEYIEDKYGKNIKADFEKCVSILGDTLRWRFWKCHICPQKNYCCTDYKMHILGKHLHRFQPELSGHPKYVDEVLADMISFGNWKPVDTALAVNLIKDRAKRGEELVYVNGWCDDLPVAKDKRRAKVLKQFAEVLKSSCPKENCTLSSTLWDWLMEYTEENLELPEVPGSYLDQYRFFKNPQCICFLDVNHLKHIIKYFKQLTTDVCASLVSTVINHFWENSLVKERIDFEGVTKYNLLLDERLLYDGEHELDMIGTVTKFPSTEIYKDVEPQGHKIVSWLLDCPEIDRKFVSEMAKDKHNLEIWFAVLRIVRCMDRKKASYYDKRQKMLTYKKMLGEAVTMCNREDTRKNATLRRNYALTLGEKYEEHVKQDDATKVFFNVVRNVLEEAESPTFEVLEDDKEVKERISSLSTTVENEVVKRSISRLRKSLKEKFILIDSKILLNEFMYKEITDEFPKLSAVEYRLVVLPFVRKFLQVKLKKQMIRNSSSLFAPRDSAKRGVQFLENFRSGKR